MGDDVAQQSLNLSHWLFPDSRLCVSAELTLRGRGGRMFWHALSSQPSDASGGLFHRQDGRVFFGSTVITCRGATSVEDLVLLDREPVGLAPERGSTGRDDLGPHAGGPGIAPIRASGGCGLEIARLRRCDEDHVE